MKYEGGQFLLNGNFDYSSPKGLRSRDGRIWEQTASGPISIGEDFTYGPDGYLAVGGGIDSTRVWVSPDE